MRMEAGLQRSVSTLRKLKACHFVIKAFIFALIEDGFLANVENALHQQGSFEFKGTRGKHYLRNFVEQCLESNGNCKHFTFDVLHFSLQSMGGQYPGYVGLLGSVKLVEKRLHRLIKSNFCISEVDEASMNNQLNSFIDGALKKLNDDSLKRTVDSVNVIDGNQLLNEFEKEECNVNDPLSRLRYEKLQSKGFINWVTLSLGLTITRRKLCHFVSEIFDLYLKGNLSDCKGKKISDEVKEHLKDHSSFHDSCNNCDKSKETLKRALNGKKSPNEQCEIHTYLINMFVLKQKRKLRYIEDCEIKDLHTIINKCRLFQELKVDVYLKEVTNARNETAHSTNNTIESARTGTYFRNMVVLLNVLSQYGRIPTELQEEMRRGESEVEALKSEEMVINLSKYVNSRLSEKKRALAMELAEADQDECDHIDHQLLSGSTMTSSKFVNAALSEKKRALASDLKEADQDDFDQLADQLVNVGIDTTLLTQEEECNDKREATINAKDGRSRFPFWMIIQLIAFLANICLMILVCVNAYTDNDLIKPIVHFFNDPFNVRITSECVNVTEHLL